MTNFTATVEEAEKSAIANGYTVFQGKFIPYANLKRAIDNDAERAAFALTPKRTTSISVPQPDIYHEFIDKLEEAVNLITQTADNFMEKFRIDVSKILHRVSSIDVEHMPEQTKQAYLREAERLGEDYIQLEKYVNLNLLGFHKILKKHDKNIPHRPVYQFYVAWLHKHKWLAGDYTQELVMLSELFSRLRCDRSGVKNEDVAQGFIRSTKKYWVREENVSQVKYTVLQHLPVFRFDETKFTGDAQLVNSIYLDNCSCELYHGRLDKRPGAQAIRLRWYGNGKPEKVFVERKVHHEDWTGESSTKDRFCLSEPKVLPYLRGEYKWDEMMADMLSAGRSQAEIGAVEPLFNAVQRKVQSAILRPTVRTQYQRTAFQIPFDATVRISLDTNLRMYKELPDMMNPLWGRDWGLQTLSTMEHPRVGARGSRAHSGPFSSTSAHTSSDSETGNDDSIDFLACYTNGHPCTAHNSSWRVFFYRKRRDEAETPWRRTEQTHFPHAVLEVKLSLAQGMTAPEWVTDLIDGPSRLGYEVHKFSKFIHGTAVLYPQCVQAVPYWIDDESLRESMLMCCEPTAENNARAGLKSRSGFGVPASYRVASDGWHHDPVDLFQRHDMPRSALVLSGVWLGCWLRMPAEGYNHVMLHQEPHMYLLEASRFLTSPKLARVIFCLLTLLERFVRMQSSKESQEQFSLGITTDGGFFSALTAVPKFSFFDKLMKPYMPRPRSRHLQSMKIEPKSFFANERTFIAWLHMAITIGSISAALLGFAVTAERSPSQANDIASVEVICMILLPVAMMLCFYALFIFLWRSHSISAGNGTIINDRVGPVCLAAIVIIAMSAIMIISLRDLITQMRRHGQDFRFILYGRTLD